MIGEWLEDGGPFDFCGDGYDGDSDGDGMWWWEEEVGEKERGKGSDDIVQ